MSRKAKGVLDVAAAVLFAAAVLPQVTGVAAHEWLGIAAVAALLGHLAASVDVLAGLWRAAHRRSVLAVVCIALDLALFVMLAVCAVSGLLVSATVLQAFGMVAPGYFVWDPLHAASSKALLALVVVHATIHAGKLARLLHKRA